MGDLFFDWFAKAESVPTGVLEEFETSLDADVEEWVNAVAEHAKAHPDSEIEKATGKGVMIGWFLPADLAKELAIKDGEPPEELHCTLLYFGKELSDKQIDTVQSVLKSVCERYAAMEGFVDGAGAFTATESSDGKIPLIRLLSVPRWEGLREELYQRLKAKGVEAYTNHGYVPHITMKYADVDEQMTPSTLKRFPVRVDMLTVAVGDEHIDFDLEGKEVVKTDEEITLHSNIAKIDKDKQQVFGWVTLATKNGKPVTDRQGDVISVEEMEQMAYSFVLNCREAGEMHEKVGVGKLVESMVFSKEKQEAMGIDLGMEGWWCGFQVTDKDTWQQVKDGKLTAFSIHGRGVRSKLLDTGKNREDKE